VAAVKTFQADYGAKWLMSSTPVVRQVSRVPYGRAGAGERLQVVDEVLSADDARGVAKLQDGLDAVGADASAWPNPCAKCTRSRMRPIEGLLSPRLMMRARSSVSATRTRMSASCSITGWAQQTRREPQSSSMWLSVATLSGMTPLEALRRHDAAT
jgi:hypothetical protein